VKPKKKVKKEYIIITKEDIAYLQQNIIEFADTAATTNVGTALLNLGTKRIQKILKKIRNIDKKKLYLNIFKDPDMIDLLNKYTFSSRIDKESEPISYVRTSSRLLAAKYFALKKNLPLKSFLKIFKVSK
jgi:hypothetical protein